MVEVKCLSFETFVAPTEPRLLRALVARIVGARPWIDGRGARLWPGARGLGVGDVGPGRL